MNHKSKEVLEPILQVKDLNRKLEPLLSLHLPITGTIVVQLRSTSHQSHTHHKKENHRIRLDKFSEGLFAAQ